MYAHELREKTDDELQQVILDRTDDLMHFRMQMSTGVVDDVHAARQARKEIARVKTIMKERTRAQQAGENS